MASASESQPLKSPTTLTRCALGARRTTCTAFNPFASRASRASTDTGAGAGVELATGVAGASPREALSQTAATSPAVATAPTAPDTFQRLATRTRCCRIRSRSVATATSTRAFSAGSTSGRGRSASAMRAMASSVSSCTVILREPEPQRVARALHAHLERGDSRAGRDSHVVVGQVFHVPHEECFALLFRQRSEGARDLLAPRDRLVVPAIVRSLGHLAELDELRAAPLARAST